MEIASLEDHARLEASIAELRAELAQIRELVVAFAHPPLMLSAAEAVTYTGLSAGALAKARKAGHLTWHNIEGSHRYSRADLDEFIVERTTSTTSPAVPRLREAVA